MHIGVEKHNDDAKRVYFSSNKWNAAADIILPLIIGDQLFVSSAESYTDDCLPQTRHA